MPTLSWIEFIPDYYTPTQHGIWPSVSPNFNLEPGKVYAPGVPSEGTTIANSFLKGATHASIHLSLNAGEPVPDTKLYNDVPRTFEIFQVPDAPFRLSESQARAKGQSANIAPRLWVGETREGTSFLDPSYPEWLWFYDELITRYEAQKAIDGVPYYVAHDYGGHWGNNFYALHEGDLNVKRAIYTQPKESLPTNAYHGNMQRLNMHLGGVYINYFDDRDVIYWKIFEMEAAAKFGLHPGIFMELVYEALPGWEHTIYTDSPAGKMGVSDKQPLPAFDVLSYAYAAHEWGDVLIPWGQPHMAITNVNKLSPLPGSWGTIGPEKWRWRPDAGSPSSFPFVDWQVERTFYAPMATKNFDLLHWGVMAHQQSMQTWGGDRLYATYRINGGPWRQRESDGSDIIWAFRDKVGIARVRRQGNYRKIIYLNPYADGVARNIEIKDPWNESIVYTASVAGPGIHVANATV